MAIILTNGKYYIKTSKSGGIEKTDNIKEAQVFYSCNRAMKKVFKAPVLCKGYYPYDTEDIEGDKLKEKQKRRKYTVEERKIIYDKSNGHCQLCGRKIPFDSMTLDHVIPLSKGGKDTMENIQPTCSVCNRIKTDILPMEFMEKITEIFLYQTQKRIKNLERYQMIKNLLQ